ncbi:MAG: amino acid adenylation domain-containing protein [Burkholderiales bacterium]|nr:amino acid adenylation domain-containing protein [Burkholderiales bacterium]
MTMTNGAGANILLRQVLRNGATRWPERAALEGLGAHLTYRQLADQVVQRATAWQAAGLLPGDRVGIAATRSVDTIVSILAALEAGLAYVPLDLSYPADRLQAMLDDAQVRAVVGEPAALDALRAQVGEVPCLASPRARSATLNAPSSLIYVLFTSGSTGRPKGVAMGEAPLAHLTAWHVAHPRLGQAARTLQFAPLSFDVHFQEIATTLATGGTLVLVSDAERRDPARLRAALIEQRVQRLYLPYVALQMLAQADAEAGQAPALTALTTLTTLAALSLQDVVSAGEQLQLTPAIRALFQRQPAAVLHNHYGPTETHVVTAHELDGPAQAWPQIPPIGQPLPHVRVWLRPVQADEGSGAAEAATAAATSTRSGELMLGGDTLAEGYLGRDDLTAERFLTDPPGQVGRWYATGDLVSQDGDGTLTYLGRVDQQLKVDGFRIEPGDIELALMAHPDVQDAVVTAPVDPDGGRVLTAHLVPKPGTSASAATWRAWLRERLPEYMIPVRFAALERLPTTPSGKIDRRGLPPVTAPVAAQVSATEAAEAGPGADVKALTGRIRLLWQELLGLSHLADDVNVFDQGARSLLVMRFVTRLKEQGVRLSVADVYDRPTVAGLAALLTDAGTATPQADEPPVGAPPGEGIAIVGMALRVGEARDLDTFWSDLLHDKETLRRFRPEELDASVPESLRSQPHFVAARGVLADADRFDAAFFGISPREATLMDPQQRLFLELCWSGLEHAGIDPSRSPGRIGVYAGSANNGYLPAMRAEQPELIAQAGEFTTMLANEKDYVATRVAHRLNLNGPAVAIHTACSTSLVAVTQAWHALAQGQCDVALAGGVTVIVPQEGGYLHVEGGMESADGRCRPFDAQASGTVFGSGGGVVVLKRLSRALADGDTVYGVIKGVGLNNDGADKASFTAPSVSGQAQAIRMALRHAQVNARSIGYVEAHGTGTALGDPIEVSALTRAWSQDTRETGFCTLGSVKGHVGHLVAAAGVLGLIKATLALHSECIPGTLHFSQANPQIDFDATPFQVSGQARSWARGAVVRRAAVSSFGVGGTNAHVIVEEAPPVTQPAAPLGVDAGLGLQWLPLSARHPEALKQRALDLAEHLNNRLHDGTQARGELPLSAVAATLMRGRQAMPVRAAVVAHGTAEAVDALRALAAAPSLSGPAGTKRPTRLVFLFPGQGSQHPGMARELVEALPAFQEAFERCLSAAPVELATTLRHLLTQAAPDDAHAAAQLAETRHAQPALFAVSFALAAWLDSLGIQPQAMIGHSIGEYAAACHAGVMTPAEAMQAVVERGAAMFAQPGGAMLAVRAGLDALHPLLPASIDVAALNAPQLSVVAGSHADIDALARTLEAQDIGVTRLKVSHAFHSASMDGALPRVQAALSCARLAAPRIPMYSCVSGALLSASDATDPGYWARQVRAPVAFSKAVQAEQALAHAPGDVLFIEVGPGQALTALIRQHRVDGVVPAIVPLLSSAQAALAPARHALCALGQLWSLGVDVAWPVPTGAPRVPLPTYPFRRERHWFTRRAPVATAPDTAPTNVPCLPTPASPPPPITMNRLPRIEQEIVRILGDVAGLPPETVDRHATFVDQGLDSLSLTQATLEFEKAFGVKMRFRRLLEDVDTVSKLAVFLDGQVPADRFAPEAAPQAAASAAAQQAGGVAFAPVQTLPMLAAPIESIQPGSQNAVMAVIQQQMQIMQMQLALLGQPTSGSASAPIAAIAAMPLAASSAPNSTSHGLSPATEQPATEQPAKNALVEKPFGASARIVLSTSNEFTPAQQQWIDDFIRRYNQRTGGSKAFSQRHRKVMADPRVVTGFNPMWKDLVYPIVADRSEGARVWDVDGNEYIDLLSCFGANFLGYKPADVTQAMVEQLQKGIEVGPQHPMAAEVADLMSEFTGMERVAFCNTGSEAVMGAMRIARTVTGRKKIAIFNNSYHGIFDEVIVRGTKQLRSLSAAPGILANAVENILVLDYDSPASLEVLRQCAHELAAIMIEPIQNKYPTLQPTAFVQQLREIATQGGAALIFDEVVTGFRVAPGGAQEFYGVRADIATYGKIIGGGLPFAAIAGNSQWLDALDGGHWQYGDDSYPEAGVTYFAGTFVRHPLALAAARATLLHIKQGGRALYQAINGRTQRMVERINAAFAERRAPVQAVHCASLWRLSWDDNARNISLFYYLSRFHGLHLYEQFGHFVTEAMSDADCERIADTFIRAMDELMGLGLIDPRAPNNGPDGGPGGGPARGTQGDTQAAPQGTNRPALSPSSAPLRQAPLTPGQTERWLAGAFDPAARRALNESFCVSLSGAVDRAALRQALADVLARHAAFRLSFDLNEPRQILGDPLPVPIAEVDLRSQADADAALDAFCTQASRRDFPLDRAPLAAASLLRLADGRQVVHVVASHLIFDGWASSVFNSELAQAYRARSVGLAPDLAPAESPLGFAVAEQARFDGDEGQASLRFWQAQLAQPPAPLSLGDRTPPSPRTFAADTVRGRIEGPAVQALRQQARQTGATLFQLLLTAVTVVLRQQSGQREFVVSVPYAAQALAPRGPLLADGVLDLPLRLSAEVGEAARSVLARVRSHLMDALDHPVMTQGTVARALGIRSSGDRASLTGIYFNLNPKVDLSHHGDLQASLFEGRKQGLLSELFFNFYDQGDAITLDLHHSAESFSPQRAGALVQALLAQCHQLAQDLSTPIAASATPPAPLLSLADPRVVAWNAATTLPVEAGARIEQWVSRQARLTPDATALVAADRVLSYAELESRANRFAHVLRERGAAHGHLVGVCMSRGADLVPALLGILKTGAAYVPLDPGFPPERLRYMAQDARLKLVVTEARHAKLSGLPRAEQLRVDEDAAVLQAAPASELPRDTRWPDDAAAYVIYTSGSTGQPKGVVLPQNAVCNFLAGMQQQPGLSRTDRLLAVTTLSFDIAVLELFLPLTVGAQVVLAQREEAMDGEVLGTLIAARGINVMQATPTTWHMLLDAGWRPPVGFKALCGGEPLPPSLAQRLLDGGIELWNMYGPTETTVWSTLSRVSDARRITVGRPIANTQVWVLDERNQPCAIGQEGELCIGGDGVATGYLHRPELSAEKFIDDPFRSEPGVKLYRTGDLARWAADGCIEHLGRLDFQVKVRGYRIELGEIEARLAAQPGVSRSVVVAREDQPGDVRLVGYVVPQAGHTPDAAALRSALRVDLPDYMVPQFIVPMDALPLLPNGKIDRKSLPPPAAEAQPARTEGSAPSSELEQAVARAMQSVLKSATLRLEDDFFALGGHSLLAARLIGQLNRELGLQLQLRVLFESPTVGKLAAAIQRQQGADAPPPRAPITRRADRSHAPLTLMQQRVAFMEDIQPGRLVYHAPSAHRLRGPMNLDAFNRAYRDMARRQEAFHTAIVRRDGGWQQIMDPSQVPDTLPLLDLSHLAGDEQEAAMLAHMNGLVSQTFALDHAPLVRSHLYRLADDHHGFFLMAHHVVWDGWSFDVLYQELSALYAAHAAGQPCPLPELAVGYGDFAAWHNGWMHSDEIRQQLAHWERQVTHNPAQQPTRVDRIRPAESSGQGATSFLAFEGDEAEALRALARRCGSPVSVVFMAVFSALMSEWLGDPTPGIGLPVRGRPAPELEGLMGFFNNMLPLRLKVRPELSGLDWVRAVQQQVTESLANQDVPFEMVAHHLRLKSGKLYQVLFNYQDVRERILRWGDLQHERVNLSKYGATEDLSFWLVEEARRIAGGFQHDTDVLLPQTADALRDRFVSLVRRLLADPAQRLSELLAPTQDERAALHRIERTLVDAAPAVDLFTLLGRQAIDTPTACALRLGNRSLTAAELMDRIHHFEPVLLAALGGKDPTQFASQGQAAAIAVALPDPIAHVVASLTALKLGARCLSLNLPLHAGDLARADLLAVVCEAGTPDSAPWPWPDGVVHVDALAVPGSRPGLRGPVATAAHRATETAPISLQTLAASASSLAALLAPKPGQRWLVVDQGDRGSLLSQVLTARIAGAEALITEPLADSALADRIAREAIGIAHLTPVQWQALLNGHTSQLSGHAALLDVTEAEPTLVQNLLSRGARVLSTYRPAQTGLPLAAGWVTDAADTGTCGHPLVPDALWLRDAVGRPLGLNAPGELCLGHGPEALPTGDLLRWRADGVLQHIGPLGRHARLNGQRIDLGAVESALFAHPDVVRAVASVRVLPDGKRALIAHIQSDQGDDEAAGGLPDSALAACLASMPLSHQPTHFVRVRHIPTQPNGDVYLEGLPSPGAAPATPATPPPGHAQENGAIHTQPAAGLSATEATLATIWQGLLDVAHIGPSDNFFELGGNSLLAMRAVEETRQALGVEIDARRYVYETLAQLAASASGPAHTQARASLAPIDASTPPAPATAPPAAPTAPAAPGLLGRVLRAWGARPGAPR